MKYINIEEIKIRKFTNLINDVSSNDYQILADLELMVIEEITAYLKNRYDTDYIFSQEGSKRNPLIVRLVIDGILCLLWERTNSNEIPISLQERCDKNLKFLLDVSKGIISPNFPTLDPITQPSNSFLCGSEVPHFNNSNLD